MNIKKINFEWFHEFNLYIPLKIEKTKDFGMLSENFPNFFVTL
jgi:hypothetical protein